MPFISRQQQVTDNGWGRGVSSPRRVLLSGPDSQGLWMWKMAEEKGSGWELWESRETSQREQWVHVTVGLVLEECHIGKVCFWGCLCSPLSEKQCCQVALSSLQMHRALPRILPRTALTSRSPLGPVTIVPSPIQVQQNYLRCLFKMQNTHYSPTESEFLV